jgi:hypothetical protein
MSPGRVWASGQVVPSGLHVGDEVPPDAGSKGQHRAIRLFGIADAGPRGRFRATSTQLPPP